MLSFAEPLDRSAAALFYRPIFEVYGLQPLPFFVVHDVLLVASNCIFFLVIAKLARSDSESDSKSDSEALLALSFFLSVPMLMDIYLPCHTIYDVLAALFGWCSAYLLISSFTSNGFSKAILVLGSIVTLQIALAAKEVAVLPALFVALMGWIKWRRQNVLSVGVAMIPMVWYLLRKLNASAGMQNNRGYALTLDPANLGANLVWYARWATDFFWNDPRPYEVLIAIAILVFLLTLPQKLASIVALCFLLGSLAFYLTIFRRNAYIFYIDIPFAAIVLLGVLQRLSMRLRTCYILTACVATVSLYWICVRGQKYALPIQVASGQVRYSREALKDIPRAAPKNTVYLVEDDPFPLDDFSVQMLMSLHHQDISISAVRLKFDKQRELAARRTEKPIVKLTLPSAALVEAKTSQKQ